MIKIGILLFQNMRYAPFLKSYEDFLSKLDNCTFKIIYLDRNPNLCEAQDDIYHAVKWVGKGRGKVAKVINSVNYYFSAKKFIKDNGFDFIIVLTTFPAVLLSGFLKKNYAGRYIVDVRDYTQEHIKSYFKKEKKVFANSALNIISSPGYKKFLPDSEYVVFHNYNVMENEVHTFNKAKNRSIIISNIGSVSYAKQWKKLIKLANCDDRFELHIYGGDGTGGQVTDWVKECNNPRIKMMGAFKPEQKKNIYLKSDIVFNCYGNERALVKYAISNRFYDGAFYKKPLIVSPGTIMEDISKGFAYSLDLEKITNLNGLYDWYTSLDEMEYDKFSANVLETAGVDNERTISLLTDAIYKSEKKR